MSPKRIFVVFWSSGGGGVEGEHSKFRGRVTKGNYNAVSESDGEAVNG